jgi:Ala-tRNA(Pro) deacylase
MDQAARALSVALAAAADRERALYARLTQLGIAWTTHAHEPVFTVEEAAALYASQPGGHTKNLFLKDKKDGLWLVVARDELRLDLNALARQLGAPRFSFGSAELLVASLGIEPGSVTPFAVMYDTAGKVRVVLDEDMLALEPLNFHPLRNDRTTAITAADLLKFIRACEHEPVIAKLPERT